MIRRFFGVVFLLSIFSGLGAAAWAGTEAGKGGGEDRVSILVFSAYSCPYCDQARSMLTAIEAKYPGKILVLYKNFPLGRDAKSLLAHEAAEAAAAQGKFKSMHDALYEAGPRNLDMPAVERIARQLGLNLKRFQKEMASHYWMTRIEGDIAEADALKVVATPTFYINGYKLEGLQAQETLEKLIEYKLVKK